MSEGTPAEIPQDVLADLDRSRQSAAVLLDKFARKLGSSPVASGVQKAAQYVQAHTVEEMAAGVERTIRKRPAVAIAVAVAAGFLVGRALRPR